MQCRLQDPNVRILDATWYLPNAGECCVPCQYQIGQDTRFAKSALPLDPTRVTAGKNPVAEFKQDRIPGSRFFDLDGVATPANNLPVRRPGSTRA